MYYFSVNHYLTIPTLSKIFLSKDAENRQTGLPFKTYNRIVD